MTEADKQAEKRITEILADQSMTITETITHSLNALLGVREIGKTNKGYWVDKFHKEVGLRPGYPWCVMMLQYVYRVASVKHGIKDLLPLNTGGTKKLGDWATQNKLIRMLISEIKPCDILIWQDGDGPEGHVGAAIHSDTGSGIVYTVHTVEGNTSSQDYRDGGTIAQKVYTYSQAELAHETRDRWLRCVISFDALYALAGGVA